MEHMKNSMVGVTHKHKTKLKMLARNQRSGSFAVYVSDEEEKGFMTLSPGLPPNM